MAADEVTCSSEDGEAVVIIKREVGSAFPAEIDWIAEDESAVFRNHYEINEGKTNFWEYSKNQVFVNS